MDLSIDNLKGSHLEHDFFIRSYLTSDNQQNDIVFNELKEMQEYKMSKTKKKLKTLTPDEDTKIHNLAVYILLTQYPNKWWDLMFQAAYNLLVGLLTIIRKSDYKIYPPKWTQKIFRTEQILSPDKIKGIIFGIDPISKGTSGDFQNYATGHAFTFDLPDDRQEYISESTKGLQKGYFMTKDLNFNSSKSVEENFIGKKKIAFVNYIRTIMRNSKAGSENIFKDAWDEYNYQWLTSLNKIPNQDIKVLIFQNYEFKFEDYSSEKTQQILKDAPRCAHPSHILSRDDHCLYIPNTYYSVNLSPTPNTNESVDLFKKFLESLKADDVLSCCCQNCLPKNILTFQVEDFELLKSLVYCGALNSVDYAVYISKLTGDLLSWNQLIVLPSKIAMCNFLVENKYAIVQNLEWKQEKETLEEDIKDLEVKIKQLKNIEDDVNDETDIEKLRNYIDGLESEFELTYNPGQDDLNSLKNDLKKQISKIKEPFDKERIEKQNQIKSINDKMMELQQDIDTHLRFVILLQVIRPYLENH